MVVKLYQSQAWLRKKYVVDKKTPEEIAKICGANLVTIYRYLEKYGLLVKR